MWGGLGVGSWDDAGSRMPHCLSSPDTQIPLLQGARVERRGKDDVLLPHLHQLALWHLLALACLGCLFDLSRFGCHGGRGEGQEAEGDSSMEAAGE